MKRARAYVEHCDAGVNSYDPCRQHFLSLFQQNNPYGFWGDQEKSLSITSRKLVINKTFVCPTKIARGLLCRYTERKCGILF